MINTINLPPFKKMCMTIGNLPTSFMESMSYYEALCWLYNYLDTQVIPAINTEGEAITELQTAFTTLQNYVDTYFDNLDVQEEVNNKLDAMALDGTLAEIINQEIFSELNDKVDNLQQTFDESIAHIAYNNIFVGTFFDATNENVHFLTSLDGQNWSEFNTNIVIHGRDPQLVYNSENKTFYLSLTQSSGVSYDFICYTSTDFVNWTQHQVDLGLHSGLRWAPELFIDTDDTMYALISCGAANTEMKIYISECTDIDDLTFGNATQLSLGITNVIDASLIKYDGTYYLTVKDNDTGIQEIFTSDDLSTFTLVNDDVVGHSVVCEGGQLLNINDRWYFYGDTWQSFHNYGLMQTDDITDFGFLIFNKSLKHLRHGTVLYLDDKDAVNLITSLPSYSNVTRIIEEESEILLSGTYESLVVYPNFMYRVNANTTINKIENPYNLQFMPFAFTTNKNVTLTVTLASGRTKTVHNGTSNNETPYLINLQGDKYMSGRTYKTISASDLWTVNDSEQFTVALYTAILSDNRLHLVFGVTKLVDSPSVQFVTFKAPYTPIGVCVIGNDKGLTMFIRSDGTLGGTGALVKNAFTYCYCDFEII